jgi:polyisoprenoid-binding protein YceI
VKGERPARLLVVRFAIVVWFMRNIFLPPPRGFFLEATGAASRFNVRQRSAILLVAIFFYAPWVETWAAPNDARTPLDASRSSITIRVYKAGLLSAFGHEHEIHANIERGTIDEGKRAVEFSVDSRTLRVKDRDISDQDRAEIQSTMLGPKVLDSEKFPEIRFHSTTVEPNGPGKWIARGELLLHGQTHSVQVNVAGSNGHYRGSAALRQRDFGISPVTIAGGSIKVKDEVRVEFEIVAKMKGE